MGSQGQNSELGEMGEEKLGLRELNTFEFANLKISRLGDQNLSAQIFSRRMLSPQKPPLALFLREDAGVTKGGRNWHLFFFFLILFSHCIARGSGYPYTYTLQLQFFPHHFFCCNMSIGILSWGRVTDLKGKGLGLRPGVLMRETMQMGNCHQSPPFSILSLL